MSTPTSTSIGLASFVRRQGLRVVEVNRCDRRKRRYNGKNHTLCHAVSDLRSWRSRRRRAPTARADSASNASTSPNRRAPSRLRSSRLPTAARSVQLVPRGARRSRSLRDSASTSPTTRCGCPQGYTLVTTCMITFFDDDTQPRCRVPSGIHFLGKSWAWREKALFPNNFWS